MRSPTFRSNCPEGGSFHASCRHSGNRTQKVLHHPEAGKYAQFVCRAGAYESAVTPAAPFQTGGISN
jgi:hypothetical protein